MLKKLYGKLYDIEILIKKVRDKLDRTSSEGYAYFNNVSSDLSTLITITRGLQRSIDSQQRTIEALSGALCDKYKQGLFIYSREADNFPMVIKDGKEITNYKTTDFSVEWHVGESPLIRTEQI